MSNIALLFTSTKVRISENNTKQKVIFFCFVLSSESTFETQSQRYTFLLENTRFLAKIQFGVIFT